MLIVFLYFKSIEFLACVLLDEPDRVIRGVLGWNEENSFLLRFLINRFNLMRGINISLIVFIFLLLGVTMVVLIVIRGGFSFITLSEGRWRNRPNAFLIRGN